MSAGGPSGEPASNTRGQNFPAVISRDAPGFRLRGARSEREQPTRRQERERSMSIEENKAVVGRWFTEFWGKDFNPAVIDELAAPDIRFEYSLDPPLRGRDAVRAFAGLKVEDGRITEEIGLDDGVTALRQLGLIPEA